MNTLPAPLVQRSAVLAIHPQHLDGTGLQASSTTVALDGSGRVLLYQAAGLFSSPKLHVVERDQLTVTLDDRTVSIAGGPIRSLRADLDPASTAFALLTGQGQVPTGERLALVDVVLQHLNPSAPHRDPHGAALGSSRATTLLLREPDGTLVADDPQRVLRLPVGEIRGVDPVQADRTAVVVRVVRPEPDGVLVGVRLKAATAGVLPVQPGYLGTVTGSIRGESIAAVALVATERALEVLSSDGARVTVIPVADLTWTAAGPRLMVRAPGVSLVADVPEEHGRWLCRAYTEESALVEVTWGEVPLGAGTVTVVDGILHVHTAHLRHLELAGLEVSAAPGPLGRTVTVGPVRIEGPVGPLAELRVDLGRSLGAARAAGDSIADLYREVQRLRTERWLWLIYGPMFLTERMLQAAGDLPAEDGEDPEHLERRRVVAETLIVADQLRSVRVRLGAAAVALPYGLLDEEADWVESLAGEAAASAWLKRHRARIRDRLRGQIRGASASVSFALADVERAVSRLDPVHHPVDGASNKSLLGRVGLGAAMMLLSPVSGTLTIASAVTSKVTDRVNKDVKGKAILDRWGPQCRSSWSLVVDVAALTAVETRVVLSSLWRELAARDKGLLQAGVVDEERLRAALVARLEALTSARLEPLPLEGETVADVATLMEDRMGAAPWELVERLTSQVGG